MIEVRPETPDDFEAVHNLNVDAFTCSELGHNGEADLVDTLRSKHDIIISLVACNGHDVVGHILFTPASIQTQNNTVEGMGLGPMSVAPDHQRTGVGARLIHSGLKYLSDNDCPFVIVLGHPEYYSRFGFRIASDYGISHGFTGIPQELFFVNILNSKTSSTIHDGMAYYSPEFGDQHTRG